MFVLATMIKVGPGKEAKIYFLFQWAKECLTAYKPHGVEAEEWAIEPTLVRIML